METVSPFRKEAILQEKMFFSFFGGKFEHLLGALAVAVVDWVVFQLFVFVSTLVSTDVAMETWLPSNRDDTHNRSVSSFIKVFILILFHFCT